LLCTPHDLLQNALIVPLLFKEKFLDLKKVKLLQNTGMSKDAGVANCIFHKKFHLKLVHIKKYKIYPKQPWVFSTAANHVFY